MKQSITVIGATAIGTIMGVLASGFIASVHSATDGRIETKELAILDDQHHTAARLGFQDGKTALQFYNQDSTLAMELAIDRQGTRSIRLVRKGGRSVASLISLQNGDSTLYLGDGRREVGIILGAIQSDVITDKPAGEFGLILRKPGSTAPLFGAVVTSAQDPIKSKASIYLLRDNGEDWFIH